jgi:hypothetical protein
MDEVGAAAVGGHRQVDAERAQGGVRGGELGQVRIPAHTGVGSRVAERPDADVDQRPQHLREVLDVNAGPAVDVGRILPGQQIHAHVGHRSANH